MSARARKKFRVLVVDDDPAMLATYRRLLAREGHEPCTEDDPLRVLANGTAETVHLLLLDLKMPRMDGLSLLAELRRRRCRAHCILLSAFLDDDLRNQARNLGVDRILEKPVDARTLRGAIAELLSSGD